MAVFKSFTFDDVKSSDHGVYITGEAVYDAPARAVEMVTIPGRNGSLALDQGRFENIEVTYPAGMFDDTASDFQSRLAAFRNILASRYTYKKLIDEYNPDEFRMGLYRSGLDVSPKQLRAGQFNITFECKPQRFLTSGEQAKTIGLWGATQTESGSMITLENNDGIGFKDFDVAVEPTQDFNGYGKPWASGCGKNLLKNELVEGEKSGITFTKLDDGGIHVEGTLTAATTRSLCGTSSSPTTSIPPGDYKVSGGSGECFVFVNAYNGTTYVSQLAQTTGEASFTVDYNGYDGLFIGLYIRNNKTVNDDVYPMIRLATETDPTWQPYENICPISGYDSVTVTRAGLNLYYRIDGTSTQNGVIFTHQNGVIIANGTATANALGGNFIRVKAGTYTIKNFDQTAGYYVVVQDRATDTYWPTIKSTNNANGYATFTITEDKTLVIRARVASGATANNVVYKPMLVVGSEPPAVFEPYNGTDYSVSFGEAGTVYKGTLDATTGIVTVTHKMVTIDGDTTPFTGKSSSSAFDGYYRSANDGYVYGSNRWVSVADATADGLICNQGEFVTGTSADAGYKIYIGSNYNLYFSFPLSRGISTLALANQYAQEHPIQFIYRLATPLTYNLTAQQINALAGTNNIWADTGDITIEYGTDASSIWNPTLFESKPLLKVTGIGTVSIGSEVITITGTSSQVIYIDCDQMEVYKIQGGIVESANGLVSFNHNVFPTLKPGPNNVGANGVSNVIITPRWWRI